MPTETMNPVDLVEILDVSLEDDNNIIFKDRKLLPGGIGGFGHAATATAERQVVLKHIPIRSSNPTLLMREATNLKRLTYHRHIVRFYNVMQMADAKGEIELILELEYCQGGSLRTAIDECVQAFPAEQVRSWMIQLGKAVTYIHELSIAHRDIKPENVFLTKKGIVKLGDFGLSKLINDEASRGYMSGTKQYMAPEKFYKELRVGIWPGDLDLLNDVWALGVVGFELAALRHPFFVEPPENYKNYFARPRVPAQPLAGDPWTSCGHKQLVERMLTYRPRNRPRMTSLIQEPYFVENEPSSVPKIEVDELHRRYVDRERRIAELEEEHAQQLGSPSSPNRMEQLANELRQAKSEAKNRNVAFSLQLTVERKRTEQQHQAEQKRLQSRIADLTSELSQARLAIKDQENEFNLQVQKLQAEVEQQQSVGLAEKDNRIVELEDNLSQARKTIKDQGMAYKLQMREMKAAVAKVVGGTKSRSEGMPNMSRTVSAGYTEKKNSRDEEKRSVRRTKELEEELTVIKTIAKAFIVYSCKIQAELEESQKEHQAERQRIEELTKQLNETKKQQ